LIACIGSGRIARQHGKVYIILEVVASKDLWIWHAFFYLGITMISMFFTSLHFLQSLLKVKLLK
jgi:hypothetical protein